MIILHFPELILSQQQLTIISTREIYECAILKAATILGESIEMVRRMTRLVEVVPGKTYQLFGATWEFFYTVHPIPTIGFRVSVEDEEGVMHTMLHSSDLTHFKSMDDLVVQGAITESHRDRMKNLVRGDEELVMLDAGGGLIHGEPADWAGRMAAFPNTRFLYYHANPSKVDTSRFEVATPGWSHVFLETVHFPQYVPAGVMQALKLFEVRDPAWANVLLSQGHVCEYGSAYDVVKKGQSGDFFYFVLNGILDVYVSDDKSGAPVAVLEAGDFFG